MYLISFHIEGTSLGGHYVASNKNKLTDVFVFVKAAVEFEYLNNHKVTFVPINTDRDELYNINTVYYNVLLDGKRDDGSYLTVQDVFLNPTQCSECDGWYPEDMLCSGKCLNCH